MNGRVSRASSPSPERAGHATDDAIQVKRRLRLQPFWSHLSPPRLLLATINTTDRSRFNVNLTALFQISVTMHNDLNRTELLASALVQLRAAIKILDRVAAPGQIAAHIDLGACQLAELLEAQAEPGTSQ